jgi:hypothetical protein
MVVAPLAMREMSEETSWKGKRRRGSEVLSIKGRSLLAIRTEKAPWASFPGCAKLVLEPVMMVSAPHAMTKSCDGWYKG